MVRLPTPQQAVGWPPVACTGLKEQHRCFCKISPGLLSQPSGDWQQAFANGCFHANPASCQPCVMPILYCGHLLQGEQPHAGFPEVNYHAHAERLARAGLRVVVIEQVQMALHLGAAQTSPTCVLHRVCNAS